MARGAGDANTANTPNGGRGTGHIGRIGHTEKVNHSEVYPYKGYGTAGAPGGSSTPPHMANMANTPEDAQSGGRRYWRVQRLNLAGNPTDARIVGQYGAAVRTAERWLTWPSTSAVRIAPSTGPVHWEDGELWTR